MVERGPEVFHEADVDQIDERLFPAETLIGFNVPECPGEFERTLGIQSIRAAFLFRSLALIGDCCQRLGRLHGSRLIDELGHI